MKSIKSKILIRFSFFSFLILLTIAIVISIKLDTSVNRQSRTLSDRLTILINRQLNGNHQMVRIGLNRMGKEAERAARIFPWEGNGLASGTSVSPCFFNDIIKDIADFVLVFDTGGNFLRSWSSGTGTQTMEKYFSSDENRERLSEIFTGTEESENAPAISLAEHGPDFMEALGMKEKYPDGERFISILAAVTRKDVSDATLGTVIAGRILNGFQQPFLDIYAASGSAVAVFAGTGAVVQAGFIRENPETMQISTEQYARIAGSSLPLPLSIEVGGRTFRTVASALKTANGRFIGAVCAGIPEDQAGGIENEFLSEGISSRKNLLFWIVGISLTGLGIFIAISLVIATEIETPIREIISGLSDAAASLAAASNEVSTMGMHLAEGASEQAASADQAAYSLSKMADAIKETSGLTRGAGQLMNNNIKKSVKTVMLLVELTEQIATIEKDSDRIANIINSIDEIAFQTNLLALNAAVEAAHAGKAGAGFAVVADEVRNLAIKTTGAARNTQELLDTTIRRIAESAGSIRDMNQDFEGIIKSSTVMGDKTASITNASKNHALVLRQISDSVAGMNEIIHQNAANAQEMASASEELNAQTEQLKDFVGTLLSLVGGMRK